MYIRTNGGIIYDLESKEVSSWEYIDNDTAINEYGVDGAFYTIYYFDENKGNYSEYDDKGGHSCVFIEEKDILDQSENLEDLCDGFYNDILGEGTFNFDDLYIYIGFESFREDFIGYRTYDNWDGDGYGFIKTSEGLIYVAKMNDKGELELRWKQVS